MSGETRYQRQLTLHQLQLLTILYSFRFSTRSRISQYLHTPNTPSLYLQLQTLLKHAYIAKRYDSSYKLAGREAEYYVTPKGLRALRAAQKLDVTDAMITATYKDKAVSSEFVQQHTLLYTVRNKLVDTYEDLQYFTYRDIQLLDYFPRPRPAGFISLKASHGISRFFLEYIPAGTHLKKIKYRLKGYMTYYDEDDWSATDAPFPAILYICENGMTEKGVRRQIELELYKADTDLQFYTTAQKSVLALQKDDTFIWTGFDDSSEHVRLDDIRQ